MDAAYIFRQGLGTTNARQTQTPLYAHHSPQRSPQAARDELSDGDGTGNRVAHTLTACCRCRQRKTRCDPNLPRCLPCERSGSTCEYFDAAKGRKISRYYVVKLQDKVRALEAELGQYTDEGGDLPRTHEDVIRPGGLIRLSVSDETPRYLGPSSGIAMTRLLMEEAKRYTDSQHIADIIPEVRARRQARMQSIQMTGRASQRKKSYPRLSEGPAESLPTRAVADKLVDVFNQKAQLLWPTLHEGTLSTDMDAVYNGDKDVYRNFIVRMVIAISLQKLDTQYAGLADSYHLAALKYVEELIRPKDLRTLQCLVLIGQYSLLTPTRVPIYFVVGLATRICQQEGLTDEQTITAGYNLDPLTIDMRRRLVWIVAAMELGLAHVMGRPSAFSKSNGCLDVKFFSTVADEHTTKSGIEDGPPSDRKQVAIDFCKMRLLQAEIRVTLYEKKRPEPRDDSHKWFQHQEMKIKAWLDETTKNESPLKPWFTGRYHQMRAFMYKPSPQIPKPSSKAARICYQSASFIIQLSQKQADLGAVDITWVFLLNLGMALNTLLWSTSYSDVRLAHPKEEVEEMANTALDVLESCAERWPGTATAAQLYAVLAKACLQSYEVSETPEGLFSSPFHSPSTMAESRQSSDGYMPPMPSSNPGQQSVRLQRPQFGQVFDSPPESVNPYPVDPNFHPTFRSNSIFCEPSTTDVGGRRFSYFPPEAPLEDVGPIGSSVTLGVPSSSSGRPTLQLPSPPDSLPTVTRQGAAPSTSLSSEHAVAHSSPAVSRAPNNLGVQPKVSPPHKSGLSQQRPVPAMGSFAMARAPQPSVQQQQQQQPLPDVTGRGDWYGPTPPQPPQANFTLTYGSIGSNLFNGDMQAASFIDFPEAGLGFQGGLGVGPSFESAFNVLPDRQGSLTQAQQMELMNVLETEGMGDIDAFLNSGNGTAEATWY